MLKPEILVVPLVAFNRQCHRLGYGGGFYDRTLARLRASGPVSCAGFAFSDQYDPDIVVEPTDQPLDCILTEKRRALPVRLNALALPANAP